MKELTIWANPFLTESAKDYLVGATKPHQLIIGEKVEHVLDPGAGDRRLLEADIAFGQPDPATVLHSNRLRWIHLSSAGYAPYDTPEFRNGLKALSAILTNSSSVFDEPCAQHLMAWLLADARQLYPSHDNQTKAHAWPQNDLREKTRLLAHQTILIVGYGAIGRGTTTDQNALLSCLSSGHLSAAYLDVTTPEPLPSEHPLWNASNCFITPHTCGGHAEETVRIVKHFVRNLLRFELGETLIGKIF
jgi:phosphoglycerate dehydrogenase-like enzyme